MCQEKLVPNSFISLLLLLYQIITNILTYNNTHLLSHNSKHQKSHWAKSRCWQVCVFFQDFGKHILAFPALQSACVPWLMASSIFPGSKYLILLLLPHCFLWILTLLIPLLKGSLYLHWAYANKPD